jgi:hypothetical protein
MVHAEGTLAVWRTRQRVEKLKEFISGMTVYLSLSYIALPCRAMSYTLPCLCLAFICPV